MTVTDLKSVPAANEPSLADLGVQLKADFAALTSGNGIVPKAIAFGEKAKRTQQLVGRGLWGSWLAANCNLSERTVHRYMALADKKVALPLADQTCVSEMTLNEAFRKCEISASADPSKAVDPAKAFDKSAKAMLEKLWKLPPYQVRHKADDTIKQLQDFINKSAEPERKIA